MRLLCSVLAILGAQRAFSATCSSRASPVCLHIAGEDIGFPNICEAQMAIEENNYEEYTVYTGRCFRKYCDREVINTGARICANFVDGTQKTFQNESQLNDYLCTHSTAKVASIPASGKCSSMQKDRF